MLHAVIMAGGSGTRFWPESTRKTPKQFLKLFGERTMLQMTVDRICNLIPDERILVVTNRRYTALVKEQLPGLPEKNIIGEPVARNTAPCIAFAAALLNRRDPEATMIVLPADHYIEDESRFISILKSAAEKAEDECLVTVGILPDRPETGYGYIRFDRAESETVGENEVRKVTRFTEKPDLSTAEQFIAEGNFLWNSGMFIWKSSVIIDRFREHQKEIYAEIEQLEQADPADPQALERFFNHCPSISIDYGIMEQSDTVYVIPGSFGWNDVGSWTALYELRSKGCDGNAGRADRLLTEEASGNLVQSSSGKLIALVGVENLAVVETENAILVCNLDKAQQVKQIVETLKEDKELHDYL